MLSKTRLAKIISQILKESDFQLYDLEFFPSKSKVLQVFIESKEGSETVGIDDCAQMSKTIRRQEELESFFEHFSLEVSSPGLNRKLRTAEHFQGAIGERLKLVFKFGPHKGNAITGVLESFRDEMGVLIQEETQHPCEFNFADLKSAKVDFKF